MREALRILRRRILGSRRSGPIVMNSVANLMREAAERLIDADPEFSSYVDVVEDILRTNDVVTSNVWL